MPSHNLVFVALPSACLAIGPPLCGRIKGQILLLDPVYQVYSNGTSRCTNPRGYVRTLYLSVLMFRTNGSLSSVRVISVFPPFAAHSMLFVNNLDQNGSHEQRARFLPATCDGTMIAGMCMSEPGAGTPGYHCVRSGRYLSEFIARP